VGFGLLIKEKLLNAFKVAESLYTKGFQRLYMDI
jgi:hypothetical protein